MQDNPICYFAETDARNRRVKFGIKANDRSRHMYVVGKTGMGKSTLLENMAIQDMRRGDGIAFVDPHGKTADLLLDYVPEDRIKDVLYFAPFDLEYPVSFNVMEDVGADRRHLVVSGLMSAFKKIWVDAWSARMEYILNNILLALLEYPGSTILGVNRMLADKDYRKKVVDNVKDVSVRAFWLDEFAKYGDRYMQEAGAAIQNKVGQFVSNPLIRNIIGQPESTFDLRKMMDQRKIIIVNLSKGRVGEQNANLLGSMFVTKLYLAAMSRADLSEASLARVPNFYLFVDEFQSFANESFANILSEARKYRLALTIAHQYIEQMSEEVRAAVFGNVGTMLVFRVGAYDAEVLEKEFAPRFEAEDIVNLGFAQVYLKLMIDGVTSPPFSAVTIPPFDRTGTSFRDEVIAWSRHAFAHPRAEVEEAIRVWSEADRAVEHAPDARRRPQGGGEASRNKGVPVRPYPPAHAASIPSPAVSLPQKPVVRETREVREAPPPLSPEPGFLSLAELAQKAQQNGVARAPIIHKEQKEGPRQAADDRRPSPKPSMPLPPKKVGTDVHREGLRSALASVLSKPAVVRAPESALVPRAEPLPRAPAVSREPHGETPSGAPEDPGEVPTAELRRVLDVPPPSGI